MTVFANNAKVLSLKQADDGMAKFPVLRYISFMKYIYMLPAKKKTTSKKRGRTQVYHKLFWVVFLCDCAGLLGSSQGSWSTACTSSCHIPACVGGKMCCRGCFVYVHEMFTLTKLVLCVYNSRKRQMTLRKTWGLQ